MFAVASGCTDYKQTYQATTSIWDVRVTTNRGDVAACRLIRGVDSRDSQRGCGLTVQPTFEECLRYQVRLAGGDTLLMNGPVGEAYDCSGHGTGSAEAAPATPAEPTPTVTAPRPSATAIPAPPSTAPLPEPTPGTPSMETPPGARVRITADRDAAKGCVYLGDVAGADACRDEHGETSGPCAREAVQAGGDLILRTDDRAQIFSCKARP